ncbi:DUF2141 domain-containing protein [Allopontixanthobacter confluentis]
MTTTHLRSAAVALVAGTMLLAAPAQVHAQPQYRQTISNNLAKCSSSAGPAVKVTVSGIKASTGRIRIQSYKGTKADWLEKGRWLNRIEAPARAGSMTFCLPVPGPGEYGIAVRHDLNGNGDTDLREDGGAMSNNPSINIFNLGKPHFKKTAFTVGSGVTSITLSMKYF